MPKLSLALLSELCGKDVRVVKAVDASGKGLDSVHDLGPCVELRKLDLHDNLLTSLDNVACAMSLTVLNLAKNRITSVEGIEALEHLSVLNLSHNALTTIGPLARLSNLKAAVLNDNQIRDASPLNGLPLLNTVVLASNRLESLDLRRCPALRKLNASKNQLRRCPAVGGCYHLKELRLNSNKVMQLPDDLLSSAQLCTLEIGQNLISKVEAISVIRNLKYLKTLNIRGNKLTLDDATRSIILGWAPSLTVLDSEKVAGRHKSFLHPHAKPSSLDFGDGGSSTAKPAKATIDHSATHVGGDKDAALAKSTDTATSKHRQHHSDNNDSHSPTKKPRHTKEKKPVLRDTSATDALAPAPHVSTQPSSRTVDAPAAHNRKRTSKTHGGSSSTTDTASSTQGGGDHGAGVKRAKRDTKAVLQGKAPKADQTRTKAKTKIKTQQGKEGGTSQRAASKPKQTMGVLGTVTTPSSTVSPPQPATATHDDHAVPPAASGVVAIQVKQPTTARPNAGSKQKKGSVGAETERRGIDPSLLASQQTASDATSWLGVGGVAQWD
eukprot:m.188793 g.188793  ORF g.188793 m.188793 type:complete len:552 (-) comp17545_c0_seq1:228-1883(-)